MKNIEKFAAMVEAELASDGIGLNKEAFLPWLAGRAAAAVGRGWSAVSGAAKRTGGAISRGVESVRSAVRTGVGATKGFVSGLGKQIKTEFRGGMKGRTLAQAEMAGAIQRKGSVTKGIAAQHAAAAPPPPPAAATPRRQRAAAPPPAPPAGGPTRPTPGAFIPPPAVQPVAAAPTPAAPAPAAPAGRGRKAKSPKPPDAPAPGGTAAGVLSGAIPIAGPTQEHTAMDIANIMEKAASVSSGLSEVEKMEVVASVAADAGFHEALLEEAVKLGFQLPVNEKTASEKIVYNKFSTKDIVGHLAAQYGRVEPEEKEAQVKSAWDKFSKMLEGEISRPT